MTPSVKVTKTQPISENIPCESESTCLQKNCSGFFSENDNIISEERKNQRYLYWEPTHKSKFEKKKLIIITIIKFAKSILQNEWSF